MTWTLSRRTMVGLGLIAIAAIITGLVRIYWTSGYLFGFVHAWVLCLYTVRWTIYQQAREKAMREAPSPRS